MTETLAYLNDRWVPCTALSLPIDDLGFLLGATVVERMRTFSGSIFRLDDHLHRLRRSLEIVGWDTETICQQVAEACSGFLRHNPALAQDGDDCYLVVFVTPGQTADASNPTVCIYGHPLPFHSWAKQYTSGVEAAIVDIRQVPAECWPAELKCRSRMHYYLADQQAHARSPGAKAVLLDQDGYVGEGTTANIVAYYQDRGLVTPPRSKVLPGVSQQVLFELADALQVPHSEADLLPEQLAAADEAFLTSTSSCLLPIVRVDGQPLGTGKPGPMAQRLLHAWSELVGVDIAAQAGRFAASR